MKRINSDIVLDTPSCLLRVLGVRSNVLLLYGGLRSFRAIEELSRVVSLDGVDDIIFREGRFCVLQEEYDLKTAVSSWGFIRLEDHAGSRVKLTGFHYDPTYREYFCELCLDQSKDALRRLSVRSMCDSMVMYPHTLLPFESVNAPRIDP